MIYKYKWIDRFMKRWFLKRYLTRYIKKNPNAYQRCEHDFFEYVYFIDITEILGHHTKHKDKKILKILDGITENQIVKNDEFSNTTKTWGD